MISPCYKSGLGRYHKKRPPTPNGCSWWLVTLPLTVFNIRLGRFSDNKLGRQCQDLIRSPFLFLNVPVIRHCLRGSLSIKSTHSAMPTQNLPLLNASQSFSFIKPRLLIAEAIFFDFVFAYPRHKLSRSTFLSSASDIRNSLSGLTNGGTVPHETHIISTIATINVCL